MRSALQVGSGIEDLHHRPAAKRIEARTVRLSHTAEVAGDSYFVAEAGEDSAKTRQ